MKDSSAICGKICLFVSLFLLLLVSFFFSRSISGQGVKVEYNKRRMSRDLLVSKDMLSLKSREGEDNCGLDKNNKI